MAKVKKILDGAVKVLKDVHALFEVMKESLNEFQKYMHLEYKGKQIIFIIDSELCEGDLSIFSRQLRREYEYSQVRFCNRAVYI